MDEIKDAIEQFKPAAIFALFSGGHDSLVNTHKVMNDPDLAVTAVVHIDTGIGIPETRQFVEDTSREQGWPLLIYRAVENVRADGTPDPMVYEDLVLKYGFPGPAGHQLMYSRLKERQIRRLIREHKNKRLDKVMLLTGLRKEESKRRMAYDYPVSIVGAQVWANPCFYMTTLEQSAYMTRFSLKRNMVKKLLHVSGECLCGCFARPGEREEIKLWFPEVDKRICRIEAKAKAAGVHCVWGTRPPRKKNPLPPGPLCAGCR